jgi:N-acetyltransferase 10
VNRDTLFSAHRDSESFLQRLMALYVASHYRNTPNDLQMLSDAPAHRLFVLLPPVDETTNALPDVLAVIQVALEGSISRKSAAAQLAAGSAPGGDLIPWTVSQQFQDAEFPSLTGARVVRIAVHPELPRMGYGSRAMALLERFYSGQLTNLDEAAADEFVEEEGAERSAPPGLGGGLLEETLRPRKHLPPLLCSLSERRPERVQWVGAAFGLTQELFNFWRRLGYAPVYLRQTASDVTGECSCVVIKALNVEQQQQQQRAGAAGGAAAAASRGWVEPFCADFRVRYTSLLGGAFRAHAPALALSLLDPRLNFSEEEGAAGAPPSAVPRADGGPLSPHDLKRLSSYASALVDHHLVRDLVPPLARAYFAGHLPVSLSYAQAAILVVLGLQQREMSDVDAVLNLPTSQVLALFNKAMRRLHACLRVAEESRARSELPAHGAAPALLPHAVGVDEDLAEGAAEANALMREQQAALLGTLNMSQYAIRGEEGDWDAALKGKGVPKTGFLSVKRAHDTEDADGGDEAAAAATPGDGEHKKKKKHAKEPGSEKKKRAGGH